MKEAPEWVQSVATLIGGYLAIVTGGGAIAEIFGQPNWILAICLILVIGAGWTFFWHSFRNPPPRNRTGKFGIGVFITTETDEGRSRVENDLFVRMTETIEILGLKHAFEIVLATNQQAVKFKPLLTKHMSHLDSIPPQSKADLRRFRSFQKRTNCHFFIWGTLSERQDAEFGGNRVLILKSDAMVLHSEIAPFRRKQLAEQFRWLKEIKIDKNAEYQGLQFSADELVLASDLVIGTAAAMVGNVQIALELHNKLLGHIVKLPSTPPRAAIQKHVRRMIAAECTTLAQVAYFGQNDAVLAKSYLDRAQTVRPNDHDSLVILARIQFEHDNDSAAALKTTHRLKPVAGNVGIWRYNIAFLEMHAGTHKSAWKTYGTIFSKTYPGEEETVQQVIDFNLRQAEKGFIPSLFIVAIMQHRKNGNLPEALHHFELFLEAAKDRNDLKYLARLANDLRNELLDEMRIHEVDS